MAWPISWPIFWYVSQLAILVGLLCIVMSFHICAYWYEYDYMISYLKFSVLQISGPYWCYYTMLASFDVCCIMLHHVCMSFCVVFQRKLCMFYIVSSDNCLFIRTRICDVKIIAKWMIYLSFILPSFYYCVCILCMHKSMFVIEWFLVLIIGN